MERLEMTEDDIKAIEERNIGSSGRSGITTNYYINADIPKLLSALRQSQKRVERLEKSIRYIRNAKFTYIVKDPFNGEPPNAYAAYRLGTEFAFNRCVDFAEEAISEKGSE